ncbi:MAG: hypothetical protein KGI41_00795 [Patescibacteria group bacterium]|nr:hypothetical protein [Patescibacteria group bacterium]MDE1965766.1 hypothetical protein [Patescibacteria group bacterium]
MTANDTSSENPFFNWLTGPDGPLRKEGSKPDSRPLFLRDLRDNPDRVANFVRSRITGWTAMACFSLETAILWNDSDVLDLIEFMKTKFAGEIAELPA